MQESRADLDLAEAVQAKGHQVNARQIRRWRAAGVLPPTTVRSLGRGRGTEAGYPDGALDIALGFAQALDDAGANGRWVLLHRAVLIAFVRGVDVGDYALEQAYRQMQATMTETLRWALEDGRVPVISFAGVKRPRGRPAKDAPLYRDLVEAVTAVVLGQEHNHDHLRRFLVEAGLPAQHLTDTDLVTLGRHCNFIDVCGLGAEVVKSGERARLEDARDFLLRLRASPLADIFLPGALDDDLVVAQAIPVWLTPIELATST